MPGIPLHNYVCAHSEFMSIIDTQTQMIGAACHSGIQAVAADKLVLLIAWGVNCSSMSAEDATAFQNN